MRFHSHFFILLVILGVLSSCILTDPDKPSSISGKVTNSSGVALADVTVQVDSTADNTAVKTAEDGTYAFDFPAGGVCKLVFGKMGYTMQSQVVAVRGGQTQTLNVVLKTLSEDAYFRVNLTEPNVSYPNTGGTLSIPIVTNVMYDFQCSAEWISCIKTINSFSFTVSGNDTFSERNATITLKPQYGKSVTINVKQQVGPFLAVIDYIGKDNATNFITSEPFVTFNRPVTLKSVTSTEPQVDLTVRYSADRKTIYFPNIKTTPFSFVSVNYTVQSDENMLISSGFDLRLFVNSQNVAGYQNMLFTRDNKYLWVMTDVELLQYNTEKFVLMKRVTLPSGFGIETQMYYNQFNNSLYLIKHSAVDNRNYEDIRIYNSETGNFASQLKLDDGGKLISTLAFNNNGYGIMVFGGKLYYFDSASNHAYGIFSEQLSLYDPQQTTKLLVSNVNTCNGFKTFILDGTSSTGTKYVFSVDIITKVVNQIYTGLESNLTTSNFSTGFFLFSTSGSRLSYFDINTGKSTTLETNNPIKILTPVVSGSEIPNALTNVLSFVSLKNGTTTKYALNVANAIVSMKSDNDGKLIAIYYGGKIYLVSNDLFGLYSSKLK